MEETVLKTMVRSESAKKVRAAGFIPGVLNGPGTASASVQFEAAALNKILTKHGPNAKLWVEIGNDKKFGFVKEIQKSPVDRNVVHIAIQLVSADQEVKMQLPLAFHGRDELERRSLQINVLKTEINVSGKTSDMPDSVAVDVSGKMSGDAITAADFIVPANLKLLDPDQEMYALVRPVRMAEAPAAEEDVPEQNT